MLLSYHRTAGGLAEESRWEGTSFEVPSRAECVDQLEKELQCELDLSRIVRCQARRPDFTEVRTEEVC